MKYLQTRTAENDRKVMTQKEDTTLYYYRIRQSCIHNTKDRIRKFLFEQW